MYFNLVMRFSPSSKAFTAKIFLLLVKQSIKSKSYPSPDDSDKGSPLRSHYVAGNASCLLSIKCIEVKDCLFFYFLHLKNVMIYLT